MLTYTQNFMGREFYQRGTSSTNPKQGAEHAGEEQDDGPGGGQANAMTLRGGDSRKSKSSSAHARFAADERSGGDCEQCDLVDDRCHNAHHGIDPLSVFQRIAPGARSATKEPTC